MSRSDVSGNLKSYLFVLIQLACVVIIVASGPLVASSPIFIVIEMLGLALGAWAIWTMKVRNFRISPNVPKDSRLVAKGPYKYIRHPMYTSLLIITFALVLDFFYLKRLMVWLILLIDLLLKLSYEEQLLSRHFSDYSLYKQWTKRLIPFIY